MPTEIKIEWKYIHGERQSLMRFVGGRVKCDILEQERGGDWYVCVWKIQYTKPNDIFYSTHTSSLWKAIDYATPRILAALTENDYVGIVNPTVNIESV